MTNKNVRQVALDILLRIEKSGGFSHLLISNAIDQQTVHPKDEALLTTLIYGSLERKLTLQYDINRFIQSKKKLDDWVEMLLYMSCYQLRFLDNVPAYAIIDEAVTIAKKRGHRGIGSLVNGVLRNAVRKGAPDLSVIRDPIERLSIETSHPKWLIERWIADYGMEKTAEMCQTNLIPKPLSIRVNPLKISREALIEQLRDQAILCEPSAIVNYGIIIRKGNIFKTTIIEDGLATVQDISSMLAAEYLEVTENEIVLDTCSAPGGKATLIAERLKGTGQVEANDIHRNKIKLIEGHKKRLGLNNILVSQQDAKKLHDKYEAASFDKIIVDAPCSGLGILRTKPDIKYQKKEKDIQQLSHVQLDILREVAPLLKERGKLVYCTCTVTKEENNDLVQAFLKEHREYRVDKQFIEDVTAQAFEHVEISPEGLQIFPQSFNADGFFVTRFVRDGLEDGV